MHSSADLCCTSVKACSSLPEPEGSTWMYTDEETLQRFLEIEILRWHAIPGVNISGMAIICKCASAWKRCSARSRSSSTYIQQEVLARATAATVPSKGAIVDCGVRRSRRSPKEKVMRSPDSRAGRLRPALATSVSAAADLACSVQAGLQPHSAPIGEHVFPAEKYRLGSTTACSRKGSPSGTLCHARPLPTMTFCWCIHAIMCRN